MAATAAQRQDLPLGSVDRGPGSARYTYRLRLSDTARRDLLKEWDRCRWVWNECVARSRAAYKAGEKCGPAMLDKMLTGWRAGHAWLGAGSTVPQQQTIRDFGRSRGKALKDIRERVPMRRRAGMPRFKKRALADPTLNYSRRGFRFEPGEIGSDGRVVRNGRLRLAGGITLTVLWSRDLSSDPSSVRVYRDSLGHWYCSFVIPAQVLPLPKTDKAVGIDWGVQEIATTTSDDHYLGHPQYGKKAAARLARYQRKMARRRAPKSRTATRGYREARRQAARAHKKVARQRQDTARKWAKKVTRDFDRIAVEDFRPKFLAKSTMARKAADGAISATKRELVAMGRKHCRDLRLVDPKHTTMDCAQCGARTKHALPLSERTYTCTACGHVAPRDKNSAQVMLIRAGFDPAGADRRSPGDPPGHLAA